MTMRTRVLLLVIAYQYICSEASGPKRVFPGRAGFPIDDEDFFRSGDDDDDDGGGGSGLFGLGRTFDLFDTRGGVQPDPQTAAYTGNSRPDPIRYSPPAPRRITGSTRAPSRTSSSYRRTAKQQRQHSFFQPLQDWWLDNISPNIKNWPKIQCVVEPTTTLKIRKTFRPLKTIVRLGADFNTQLGVWQFKSSWEDAIIGGKLTLAGRELQLTKSWQLSVGAVEDLVTRLRFRAAVDLSTWKAYARVGFRTERLRPINVMEGFTLLKQLPLDGNKGHVKLEVKANLALPEPEIEYSTETQRSLVGMGDIEINIEELNLVLDY